MAAPRPLAGVHVSLVTPFDEQGDAGAAAEAERSAVIATCPRSAQLVRT